jgi:sphingolipid delta-4 desaturase
MKQDFHRSFTNEPHSIRRKQILEKYPQIGSLFGPDPRPIPYVIALVVGQIVLSYYQKFWSWPVFFIVAYVVGGTASQALLLMAHELSHNLVFQSVRMNDFFGIFCNIGNGFPSATMFKRYHMEHHQFQGKS